jgi:hypothetical protein
MKTRAHLRLISMPCCGQMLCWVNPRLPNYCPKKLLLIGAALWVLFYASGAHAIDMCREPDSRCYDINGKRCYKLNNCCKISHDWATEIRDKTVCKQKPRK